MTILKHYLYSVAALLLVSTSFSVHPKEVEQPLAPGPAAAPFLGNGGLGNLGPQGVAAPFKPDDLAAQEEFNQILEELNQMPEEKLQELEKQLQSEVKRELEAMTPERRAEFDREMAEFWRSQGVDPNQLPSLDEMLGMSEEQKVPETVEMQQAPEQTQKHAPIIPTDYGATDAQEIIGKLIDSLESLRRKMAAHPQLTRKLQAWKEAIDDLVYFLKVMDQPEHHERIVAQEFEPLLKHLKSLQKALASAEPLLMSSTKHAGDLESPYEILRVDPTASDVQIRQVYETYLKEHDPLALRAQLEDEGFEEAEISGRVKAATINIRTIKDAYAKISNPQIRAQTDRALAAAYEQSHAGKEQSQGALNTILDALSQAIYQKNVLEDMQRFMKKYEPVKLEQRKKMEEAERKQRKEQETASKLRPIATPTSPEPYYLQAGPSYQPTGGYYPGYGQAAGAPAERNYGQAIEKAKVPEAPGKGSKSIKEGAKKEEAQPGAKSEKGNEKEKEKKKNPAVEWTEALQALNKELDLLDSDITLYDSTAATKIRPKADAMIKLQTEIAVAAEQAEEKREAEEAEAKSKAEADEAEGAEAPELPAAPSPEQLKQLRELANDVVTFLESSPREEAVQKALSKFAKADTKVVEDKIKLQNKDKSVAELVRKPAFTLLAAVAQTPQPEPVRGKKSADLLSATPKTKKLMESVNSLINSLAAQQEKAA